VQRAILLNKKQTGLDIIGGMIGVKKCKCGKPSDRYSILGYTCKDCFEKHHAKKPKE